MKAKTPAKKPDQSDSLFLLTTQSWLTDQEDPYDIQRNQSWESKFHELVQAIRLATPEADDLIRQAEEAVLSERIVISPRQEARLWFTIGMYQAQQRRYHDAFEAFFGCKNYISETDILASIIVRAALAGAAQHIDLLSVAVLNYSLVLSALHSTAWEAVAPWTNDMREEIICQILLNRSHLALDTADPISAEHDLQEAFAIVARHIPVTKGMRLVQAHTRPLSRRKIRGLAHAWEWLYHEILELTQQHFPEIYALFIIKQSMPSFLLLYDQPTAR